MGGRGGSSGIGGGGGNPNSAEYKSAYASETSNIGDFSASFAVEPGATKDAIGYQMYVHKSVTGNSLIAETQREVDFLKSEYKSADAMGKSYGMSKDAIGGMKAGIKAKIEIQEKAINAMQGARSEYEKYSRQASIGSAKAKRRGGRWM